MDRKDLEMEKDAPFPEESGTEGADYGELLKTVPGYQSQYAGQIQDMYNQISQRQPFNYDVNADAMYQALKDQYVTGGRMAMMDTMGQAATLTGGYGNSYAQNVGQQAYQGYLQGLNDHIPDLYNQALQNYIAEGDRMLQNFGLLQDMDQNAYGQYMDRMELVQPQVLAMLERGIRPSQEMLDASGLSQEYIDAMFPEDAGGSGGWDPLQDAINAYWAGKNGDNEPPEGIPMYGDIVNEYFQLRDKNAPAEEAGTILDDAVREGYISEAEKKDIINSYNSLDRNLG